MRRLLPVIALLFLPVFSTACFSVKTYAPPNAEVRLLGPDDATTFETEYKAWYLFWGLWQVSSKRPADVIEEEGLTEVRFATQDKKEDVAMGVVMGVAGMFIGLLNGIIPLPQTVKLYGNQ